LNARALSQFSVFLALSCALQKPRYEVVLFS